MLAALGRRSMSATTLSQRETGHVDEMGVGEEAPGPHEGLAEVQFRAIHLKADLHHRTMVHLIEPSALAVGCWTRAEESRGYLTPVAPALLTRHV